MQFTAILLASLATLAFSSPVPDTWYPLSPAETELCAKYPTQCYTSMLAALVAKEASLATYGNPLTKEGDFYRHCLWSAHNVLALPADNGELAEMMCIAHEKHDDGDSEDAKKMYLAACKVGRKCALDSKAPAVTSVEKCCKAITDAGRPKGTRK